METPGQRIRKFRVAKGLTQKDLAQPRYTAAHVSTIESGRRQPSREALAYFGEKLGVDVHELLTGQPPNLVPKLELELQEVRVAISAGRHHEARKSLQAVGRQARRFRLRSVEAKVEELTGLILERQGQLDRALERYQAAEGIVQSAAPTLRVDAVIGIARCRKAMGDVRYAVHLLESFKETLARSKYDDPDCLVRVNGSLITAYIAADLLSKADSVAHEALALAPRVSDPLRLAQMHMYVARLLIHEGDGEQALRSLGRAEDLFRQLQMRTEMGGAHLARGYVLSRELRLEEARGALENARSIFEETCARLDEARALIELGRVERLASSQDAALRVLEAALQVLGDRDALLAAYAYREIGLTFRDSEPDRAERHLRDAIRSFERCGQRVEVAVTCGELAELLREQGEAEAGWELYRTGMQALAGAR